MDFTDPDPKNWTAFGEHHDKQLAEQQKHAGKPASKGGD